MATQTVEFRSPPSQNITAKLFTVGSDTEQVSVSATEATNRKGTYSAEFTDEAAGEYELIAFVGAVPVARWFVTLTLTTATFQVYDKVRAELDSASVTAVQSGLATETNVTAVGTAVVGVLARIGSFTGTGVNNILGFLRAMFRSDASTPSDMGGTATAADHSLQAIRVRGDAEWTTGGGGGGGGPSYSAAVVVARLPVGAAAGWPQEILCGSAYLTALGTHVPMYVKDVDDNILAEMGDKTFTDGDFKAILRLSPLTDANKLLAQPAATIEVDSDDSPGIVFNDDVDGEEYFELQMPKAKTAVGEIRTRYLCQLILRWGDGSTYEWYVNLGESKFIRGVAAAP